ncbi:hypothetical protein E8E14_005656 [Neopestalotiopsis sp. 37M]|nr:hypothetical protein E8E14_005656 [Neopestalotiopsis sp. 37M]
MSTSISSLTTTTAPLTSSSVSIPESIPDGTTPDFDIIKSHIDIDNIAHFHHQYSIRCNTQHYCEPTCYNSFTFTKYYYFDHDKLFFGTYNVILVYKQNIIIHVVHKH